MKKNPFKNRISVFDIIKSAKKKFSRQQKPKKQKQAKPSGEQRAKKLNEEFDYAETILKAGSDKIARYLDPLLRDLSGGQTPTAGMSNKYFEIDDEYDGDPFKLFQHVKFKEIPETDIKANQYIDKLEQDPHMSQQQYEDYSKQYHSQAYNTLASRLNLSNFEALEQIMNSSPAWQIAKRGAMDSNQVLERWQELYSVMNEAQQNDTGIFDWAIQQIENGKHSINWLINAIDDEIKLMLAGKYSHRRQIHY